MFDMNSNATNDWKSWSDRIQLYIQ